MLLLEVLGPYNVKLEFLDYIELTLWTIVSFILVFGCLSFLKQYKKTDNKFFLIASIQFAFFLVGRIIRIYLQYVIGQYWESKDPYTTDVMVFLILAGGFFSSAILLVYYNFERKLQKTHYLFSLMSLFLVIFISLEIITRDSLVAAITAVLYIIASIGLPSIYVYIALNSTGKVRKRALIISLGMALVIIGISLVQLLRVDAFDIIISSDFSFIFPLLQIIGFILVIYGFKKEEES